MGQFIVTKEAAEWYKEEMGVEAGESIQFFVKIYGGIPTNRSNYFLGVTVGDASSVGVQQTVEGITFYFSERDAWFIEGNNMKVDKAKDDEEVQFIFD